MSQLVVFFLFYTSKLCHYRTPFACLLKGDDFRKDYSHLSMLCSIFPNVPVVALTATASKNNIDSIKESLKLRNPLEVIGNPNRPNIHYEKVFHKGRILTSLRNCCIMLRVI